MLLANGTLLRIGGEIRGLFQNEDALLQYWVSHYKNKRSHDRLVFIMGIHHGKMVFILKRGQDRWPLCVHGGRQWEIDGSITMDTSCGLVAYQMKFYKYIPLLTSRYSYIVACLYGLTLRVPASYIYACRTWSSLCLHIHREISWYFGFQSMCYIENDSKRQKQRLPLLPAIKWV